MTSHAPSTAVRRAARMLALLPALLVTGLSGTAFADTPATWEDPPSTSPLEVILLLGIAPLGLFLLITLLVYLPSMGRAQAYQPGHAWHGEAVWFGGPRGGLEAAERTAQPTPLPARHGDEHEQGGTSGRW